MSNATNRAVPARAHSFDVLSGYRYVNLTTFRKNGEAVPTTVWFALVDGRAYVRTDPLSGKMKRIRNNPRVMLTPSTVGGKARGEAIEGVARIVEGDIPERIERALYEKYGLQHAAFNLFLRFSRGRERPREASSYLEIRLASSQTGH